MKGFIYILENDKGAYYIGSTSNLERRLKQHQNGHTQTTRNLKTGKLVFTQEFENLNKARLTEKRLKLLKRKDYIRMIIKDGKIKLKI